MKRGNLHDQLMATAAHRYSLGRMSYMVGVCIEWLDLNWPNFDEQTRMVILRDTKEAIEQDVAGMDFDKKAWMEFVKRHEQSGR